MDFGEKIIKLIIFYFVFNVNYVVGQRIHLIKMDVIKDL